jgi:hypothetical protein
LSWIAISFGDKDPKHENKASILTDWQKITLETEINWRGTLNIGILCGETSGIICLDIDEKERGVKIFKKLVEKYGLPEYSYDITPNGDNYYIFEYTNEIKHIKSSSKMVKLNGKPIGSNIKSNGKQFVCEPSVNRINKKPYKWIIS